MAQQRFLKYTRIGQLVMGTYPFDSSVAYYKRFIYRCYHWFLLIYFILFMGAQWTEVFLNLKVDPFKTCDALYILLLYMVTFVKQQLTKNKNITNLIKQLEETEELLLESDDVEVHRLLDVFVSKNFWTGFTFYLYGTFTLLMHWISPFLRYVEHGIRNDNATYQLSLPFALWLPFDKNEYYVESYVYIVFGGMVCGGITMINDAVLWSLLLFLIFQIKLLQYKMRSFKSQVREFMVANKEYSEHQAMVVTVKKLAKMFEIIIKFTDDLNTTLSIAMLMDFLIRSLQLGVTLLRVVVLKSIGAEIILSLAYLTCMLQEMMYFYWFGNEISLESAAISSAVWECDWVDLPDDIKKMLNYITFRSQRPLILKIGPFTVMSTATAITILRASYSYVALLNQMYG